MSKVLTDLRKLQDADLQGKVVLVRVDHNVVKDGSIKDPFRIDITFATMFNILAKGGKLILMTHVGRPKDKATGNIKISKKTSVQPIVEYLKKKLNITFYTPEIPPEEGSGLIQIPPSIKEKVKELKEGKISGIYLPNTRWFKGEEDKGEYADQFAQELAELADVFVNDAFGSWQSHVSTVRITKYLPSYAGLLMQSEISNLEQVFEPQRPILAVVAGSKFDTKIGPLRALLEKVDHLILGGVIYNAYLAAKYDLEIAGLTPEDIDSAREFLEFSKQYPDKIIEPSVIVESDSLEGKVEDQYRNIDIHNLQDKKKLNYILDVAAQSFADAKIKEVINNARSVFVNAVMGLTPHFAEGTIALFNALNSNSSAFKMYGGGDTLQEFRTLLPGKYLNAIDDQNHYFFSGGGTVLTAIEENSVLGLEPVKALLHSEA
ncbi:MAG: phosphoglycerate kinase [Candidatus Cloacimonetes bacterium]|nr:phosphoglycerate kinase [Candidatus Cloacimonadota bacterium]